MDVVRIQVEAADFLGLFLLLFLELVELVRGYICALRLRLLKLVNVFIAHIHLFLDLLRRPLVVGFQLGYVQGLHRVLIFHLL